MAIMIPDVPHTHSEASMEGLMFSALKKLPKDYYVLHSMKIATVKGNTYSENEGDFIIFNQYKGVLCLEAKAGHVKYENGKWYYGNGVPMKQGGPFRQADHFKYRLIDYINEKNRGSIITRCKFVHAVWFPSVSRSSVDEVNLPSDCPKEQVLTKEALENPLPFVDRIFSLNIPIAGGDVVTKLSSTDAKIMIEEILCPHFDIFPINTTEVDIKKIVFHQLLEEQIKVLDFLSEQRSAVINGAAGTGKTMVALEKARRHANFQERVLFLCYNYKLREYLVAHFENEYIDYYTIDGFACKLCNNSFPDYEMLRECLLQKYIDGTFGYKHIIIDEGQDFGFDNIEEASIIDLLESMVVNEIVNGTFYIFYDNLQLVQADKIPGYIRNADCKLTLYRNCRNTINIAKTSLRPISERRPNMMENCIRGTLPTLRFCSSKHDIIASVDRAIANSKAAGYVDTVLLTCKTEGTSWLSDFTKNDTYKEDTRFFTCRKFKGLEADSVILVDVDAEAFYEKNILLFYVGASRARLNLEIISSLNDDECANILQHNFSKVGRIKHPKKELANTLNSIPKVD